MDIFSIFFYMNVYCVFSIESPYRCDSNDIFLIFYNMKVYCVFSIGSPHRGDSNEYSTIYHFQYVKEKHLKLSQICSYGIVSKVQLFDLFRRTHLFWSISILSPALNKVSAKYTFGHFP